jgi:hypothetical protein
MALIRYHKRKRIEGKRNEGKRNEGKRNEGKHSETTIGDLRGLYGPELAKGCEDSEKIAQAVERQKIVMLEPNDFFHNQVKQCRAQAESAANKNDRDFWLEFWERLLQAGLADSGVEQKFTLKRTGSLSRGEGAI